MTRVTINGVEINVNDGIIIKDKYTEELDTAMITIPYVNKLNLSPFDFVEIIDDRFTKYFVIDTWVEETVGFNPMKYTYNINLISETVKLQKVVMPNIAITQPIGSQAKTIGEMLEKYLRRYITKQYPELQMSNELYQLTDICPEMLFNRPTAFEVFNTLLAKENAIVRITNHVIEMIRLDQYGNEIDESKIYYDNNTQSLKDYANRLDTQVNNGISSNLNVYTADYLTIRGNESDALLTDDNMQIVLPKPIYEDGLLFAKTWYNSENTAHLVKLNLSSYLVEKSVYDTYYVSSSSDTSIPYHKRYALYYVRGDNKIQGLGYSEKVILGLSSDIALYNVLKASLDDDVRGGRLPNDAELSYTEADIKDHVMFEFQYSSSESFRYNALKDNTYNATLIDNQTETQIDTLNFGKTEQQKLSRLGNKARIITGTFKLTDTIPQLSDYIDDYILAEREIVYYKDFADFRGYLYKDYVIKNMFYGLNSKKRSTQISTESVVRNEIINYDCKFELSSDSTTSAFSRYILMPLAISGANQSLINDIDPEWFYTEFPKYAFVQTFENQSSIQGQNFILLTPSTYVCGKSNVIHLQFQDNFSAGMRLDGNVTGGIRQRNVSYTNEYGEFDGISVSLYTNSQYDIVNYLEFTDDLDFSKKLPLISAEDTEYITNKGNEFVGYVSNLIYKDNRETMAFTFNINFKDSGNVIIGDLAEYTGIGQHYNRIRNGTRIYYSTTEEYETGDEYAKGTLLDLSDAYINFTKWIQFMEGRIAGFNDLQLATNQGVDTSNWKSWGIVEAGSNRLILGVNKGNEQIIPRKIYLNYELKDY